MTLDALRREFEGLAIEYGTEKERLVAEGRGHKGQSAVVQFLARKA
jgi:hypothetical protein